jgi:hypothetical protein
MPENEAAEQWLTRVELCERIKVPINTVAQWGRLNKGPRFAKFGRHVRYALSDVIAWEQAQFQPGRN